jgi:hypothetical protein
MTAGPVDRTARPVEMTARPVGRDGATFANLDVNSAPPTAPSFVDPGVAAPPAPQ